MYEHSLGCVFFQLRRFGLHQGLYTKRRCLPPTSECQLEHWWMSHLPCEVCTGIHRPGPAVCPQLQHAHEGGAVDSQARSLDNIRVSSCCTESVCGQLCNRRGEVSEHVKTRGVHAVVLDGRFSKHNVLTRNSDPSAADGSPWPGQVGDGAPLSRTESSRPTAGGAMIAFPRTQTLRRRLW